MDGESSVLTGESTTYEIGASEGTSEAVIRAVADASGYDAMGTPETDSSNRTLDPLYSAVDPDALDALFSRTHAGRPRGHGQVTFTFNGYVVTVHSHGIVRVEPLQDRVEAAAESTATD